MAGETILVVDDSAVNLKLAAAVLRSDGYRVILATSAEQALMTLRTTLPDLVLVDIQLPGMSGLEMTRQLREETRTRDLRIVVLSAAVEQGCEQQAFEAGCDGFIGKPIDTRTLGARLRTFIDGATIPSDPPQSSEGSANGGAPAGLSLAGPEMESLRRTFLTDGLRQVRRMMEFAGSAWDGEGAARHFHQWAGSAGALGYPELGERARNAEALLARPAWTQADLRIVLSALAEAFAGPREAADTPIPPAIAQALERKRIALVGFADEEAERICVACEKVRALPRLFAADEPADSESIHECSVVMVHVREETRNLPWLQPDFAGRLPLVLVGTRDDLIALPPAVQTRACEFLIDGWQPEEVVMRLSFALARVVPSALVAARSPLSACPEIAYPEIVIADDDANVVAIVRSTLESLGMNCRAAASGPEALALIRERCPQAAVLDVNMPGMNGFEVLAGIRDSGNAVKVILLTARQQERDILRGFELGADDYVVKPFNPLELAARLKRLM
ncbi:MAG: response regulator receiver protein [Candidatus Solibacter sp.]|nr:response regulator receiver protein [Candidatus Solibacter sp.]